MVVTKDDLEKDVLKIILQAFPNQLAEVLVEKNKIKSPIKNSQEVVDKKYFDDEKSSPKNAVMPNYNVTENGINFVRMYKDVLKILKKKNPKKNDFTSKVSFTEVVMNRINYPFFNSSLKLHDDEIKLFLVFCENDSKATSIIKSSTDFELMDFLVNKNKEFKTITALKK